MTSEFRQPGLSLLQAGPFILEADFLINHYALREPVDDAAGEFNLGPKLGPLNNRQALYCISRAVSHLLGNDSIAAEDGFWIRETICALYHRFSARLLAAYPHQPEADTLALSAFLDELLGRRLGRPHTLPYDTIPYATWEYGIEVGGMVLEGEFPPVPKPGSLVLPPRSNAEYDLEWLRGLAESLRSDHAPTAVSSHS
jgi:hypothetical protein